MNEISFRGQTAQQIIPVMIGKRLAGAVADLSEITLNNLFGIAMRRGYTQAVYPQFSIYHLGSGEFDASFELES